MASVAPGSDNVAQADATIRSELPYLCRQHAVYSGGCTWALTPQGISIDDQPPVGAGGQPITIGRIWRDYGSLVDETAAAYGVPIELILAFIATESAGDPSAIRYEPGYVSDDATPDRVSIGLMQTLISTARWILDDPALGFWGSPASVRSEGFSAPAWWLACGQPHRRTSHATMSYTQ